jgi:restriction endonuclease
LIALSVWKIFYFSLFPPSFTLICRSSFSPYPFPFSVIAHQSKKKLHKIQEIVKKVYHDKALTRTQLLAIIKRQSRRTGSGSGRSEKSHWEGVHYHIAAKVENDRRETVMKLAQAHDVSAKTVHATLHKNLLLSGSQPAA